MSSPELVYNPFTNNFDYAGNVGGSTVLKTVSDTLGNIVNPSLPSATPPNNVQFRGEKIPMASAASGFFSNVFSGVNQLNFNPMTVAKWIVDQNLSNTGTPNGTHTTIQGAINDASAGDSIYIMPGTYPENLTISKNINLFSSFDTFSGFTVLNGNITFSGDVIATFNGFRIVDTGVDTIIADGSGKLLLYFNFIEFILTSSVPALSYTNSGQSSITFFDSYFSLPGGSQLFNQSSGGEQYLNYTNCSLFSQGTTPSTASSGITWFNYCTIDTPIITSGSNNLIYEFNDVETYTDNATMLTIGGSGTNRVLNNYINSGSSPCISISSNANVYMNTLYSTNVNCITGVGTLNYANNIFSGTSSTINTTTQIPFVVSNDAIKVVTPASYAYTTQAQDGFIKVDTTVARTINLLPNPVVGQRHTIKDTVGSADVNAVTISGNGKNIDNQPSISINNSFGSYDLVYTDPEWSIR